MFWKKNNNQNNDKENNAVKFNIDEEVVSLSNKQIENKDFLKIVFSFVFLFILILISIHVIRNVYFNGLFPLSESYYNYRVLNELSEGNIFDSKIIYDREVPISPYGFIVSVFNLSINSRLITILPYIFSIVNLILFMFILKGFSGNKLILFSAGIFYVTSPEVIFSTISLNASIFSGTLMFLIVSLLLIFEKTSKKYLVGLLIIFFTLILSFSGINDYVFFILLFFVFFLFVRTRISSKKIYYLIFGISLLSFFVLNYTSIISGTVFSPLLNSSHLGENIFTDLGSPHGIRILDMVLSIIGISLIWNMRSNFYISSLISVFLIIYSFFNSDILYLLVPVFVVLCSITYSILVKMEWELVFLKKLFIVMILISLIFSSVQFIVSVGFSRPNIEEYESLLWLHDEGKTDEVVFSSKDRGFMIESVSDKKVVFDNDMKRIEDFSNIIMEYDYILFSRDIHEIRHNFNKWNVSYVYIDPIMKEKIWDSKIDGLYFVIKNSLDFEEIYNMYGIEIYSYNSSHME